MISKPILFVENLYKKFRLGKTEVEVLKGLNLKVNEGEIVAVIGPVAKIRGLISE